MIGLKKKIGLTLKQESLAANNKMSLSDIKLYAMNAGTIGVTTFTRIEDGLKILLLIVTIGYTLAKWHKVNKNCEKK